ncbi:hypothetical protein [Nonomuraea longicatena]|uniref:Uncharacterized protein n=1 Tax=Nonomuraea longicatena TaxID=83682 RepID=A0ABN1QNF0_9ACTN
MKVRFLGTTSDGGGCPAAYDTDRRTFIVQGKIVSDPEALAGLVNLAPDETVVEIPKELLRYFTENR